MSTHYADIASALDSALNALGRVVAWENRHFTPPTDGTLYLRQTNLSGDTSQADLGASGQDYSIGIYQIDVIAPFGKGKAALYTLADTVADSFKRGTTATYNGVTVRVRNVMRDPMVIDQQQAMIPVVVYYEAYTAARA
jgi:hypothetical protein